MGMPPWRNPGADNRQIRKKPKKPSATKNQKIAHLIKGISSLRISRSSICHAENFRASAFEFKFNAAPAIVGSFGCGPDWSERMGRQDNVAAHPVCIDFAKRFWFFLPEHVARHSFPYGKL